MFSVFFKTQSKTRQTEEKGNFSPLFWSFSVWQLLKSSSLSPKLHEEWRCDIFIQLKRFRLRSFRFTLTAVTVRHLSELYKEKKTWEKRPISTVESADRNDTFLSSAFNKESKSCTNWQTALDSRTRTEPTPMSMLQIIIIISVIDMWLMALFEEGRMGWRILNIGCVCSVAQATARIVNWSWSTENQSDCNRCESFTISYLW